MSKLINELVAVAMDSAGKAPRSFKWRGKTYRVRQVERIWKQMGEWWHGQGEETFYRLTTSDLATFDLVHRSADGSWVLQRIYD